ncbi:peptidoglycan-binding domain-containing protein [Micavibrio aeruginosavorus]|uniref:Putative peptidoglycan binding domain protein n=1 Tax=Micavibrio aeruginosavorus (strain ARL-13) TaxID=856793 RepID=G2KPF4_MICAA|nr:peptidoglycan-binding domain-containing protein [Micavibrio aeruginosavorus]AEP09454.1 putative peptidoglycan binding domain protein [Micavibrio aeruginosavorus ARL-13]
MGSLSSYAKDCFKGGAVQAVFENPGSVRQGPVVNDAASVKTVQTMLNDTVGAVRADGMWGTGTSTAFYQKMTSIQEQNGLPATGQYDVATAQAMRDSGMVKEADALDKMQQNGVLQRVYNPKLAQMVGNCTMPVVAEPDVAAKAQQNNTPEHASGTTMDALKGAVRNIQGAMGMTQTGDLDIETQRSIEGRIRNAQQQAGLPQTGQYNEQTAIAMRASPEHSALATAFDDAKVALAGGVSNPAATDALPGKSEHTVVKGGIETAPLKPSFFEAVTNFGSQALDVLRGTPTQSVENAGPAQEQRQSMPMMMP